MQAKAGTDEELKNMCSANQHTGRVWGSFSRRAGHARREALP